MCSGQFAVKAILLQPSCLRAGTHAVPPFDTCHRAVRPRCLGGPNLAPGSKEFCESELLHTELACTMRYNKSTEGLLAEPERKVRGENTVPQVWSASHEPRGLPAHTCQDPVHLLQSCFQRVTGIGSHDSFALGLLLLLLLKMQAQNKGRVTERST